MKICLVLPYDISLTGGVTNHVVNFAIELQEKGQDVTILTTSSKNNFLVNGTVNIRDLNKQIGTNLPVNNASTVAGLILYESRIIPKKNQVFSFFGLKFKILAKKNNQLIMLKISKNN